MKALGKDIKEFWLNHWPDGFYVEDAREEFFNDDGVPIIEDATKYDLADFGYLAGDTPKTKGKDGPFSGFFHRWRKQQTTATILVTVPRAEVDEALELLTKHLGMKAVKS